jgi:hypothetical protein
MNSTIEPHVTEQYASPKQSPNGSGEHHTNILSPNPRPACAPLPPTQDPGTSIQDPAPGIENPKTSIQNPDGSIQNPNSQIQQSINPQIQLSDHPESSIENPAASIQNPDASIQDPESSIQNRATSLQNPDPPIQQSNNPAIQPDGGSAPPRGRNGKIARLPYLKRDLVNRMLRDNLPYSKIVRALDDDDIRVTERNVSNWKTRGGYKAWCLEQDRAVQNRLQQDNLVEHLRKTDASQLPEVGLQIAATNLSQFFLKPETQNALTSNPAACRQAIADLCRLSRHVHALQKYRDDSAKELGWRFNPERARRKEEKDMEMTREIYCAAKLGEDFGDPIVRGRNYIPKERVPELPPQR